MATRLVSVHRRKPGLIDILTPFTSGIEQYRLSWAPNFDQTFTDFLDAPPHGYRDASVDIMKLEVLQGRRCRIVLDPTTFSIPDDATFWMTLSHIVGGVVTNATAPLMILPPHQSHHTLTIAGSAPPTEIQLDLPRTMTDVSLVAEDDLLVRFGPNEAQLAMYADTNVNKLTTRGGIASVFIQGNGKTSPFSMTFTSMSSR